MATAHQDSLLTHWIKVCGPLRKPTSDYFQAFNWPKNNFGEITYLKGYRVISMEMFKLGCS